MYSFDETDQSGFTLCMHKYPTKKKAIYTQPITFRIEPELKRALEELKATTTTDVVESIRMKIRELVKELAA